ncbi:MAG TPA: ArsR family transcriptional regulator [Chloroflexota bacterium]|nr:ArsR family transcriptional regulator [Chloroflexota bacterium]
MRLLSTSQNQPEGDARFCHLTEPLGLGQPTVSHHLNVLRRSRLSHTSGGASGCALPRAARSPGRRPRYLRAAAVTLGSNHRSPGLKPR